MVFELVLRYYINTLLLCLFFSYFTKLYFCAPTATVFDGEVDSPLGASSASESAFDVGPVHANFHDFHDVALEFITFAVIPGLVHAQSFRFPMLSVIIEQHERLVVSIVAPKLPCSFHPPPFILLADEVSFQYIENSHLDSDIILLFHLVVPELQRLRIQKFFPIF